MITSVCVLGYSEEAMNFISEYKKAKYYKKRDSDTEGVRIHVLYAEVDDLSKTDLLHRYELAGGENYANVLRDGDQETKKEVTFSNDREWLLESNGHDTIVETVESADIYYATVLQLIRRGFSIHLTSSRYKEFYLEEILAVAKESGARVTTHENVYSVLQALDSEYGDKLSSHRGRILAESYNVDPCGLG